MSHLLSSVTDLPSNIWHWLHLWQFWIGLLFISTFASLFRLSWSALAGIDARWNEEKFKEIHPNSNWNKATTRRYSWVGLGLFYYVLWLCAALWWLDGFNWNDFNRSVYFAIATLWLITAPLRNIWLIVVARKVDAKRGKKHKDGLWEEVSQYYDDALTLPGKPPAGPWFSGRLKRLNFFQKFRFVFRIFRFWGVLGIVTEMLMSLAWPFFMGAAVFWYLHEAEDYANYRAWWRFDRKSKRN